MSQKVSLPHFNIRLSLPEGLYTFDFYYYPTAPNYVEAFVNAWQQTTRQFQIHNMGEMSTAALYFTACPKCGIYILTNRAYGKILNCKLCETTHNTSPLKRPDLDKLLNRILAALGREVVDITRQVYVLLVQPWNESDAQAIEEMCRAVGFKQMPKEYLPGFHLWIEGIERGVLNEDQPYSIWEKTSSGRSRAYANETPSEVEQVLRIIRGGGKQIRSLSMIYDPTDSSIEGLALQGKTEELEARLRQELLADPWNTAVLIALIEILIHRGKLDEAREKALAATRLSPASDDSAQSWRLLGRVEISRGYFQEAIKALEKALNINPVDRRAMFYLARCYEQLGNTDKAAALIVRGQSLGGSL